MKHSYLDVIIENESSYMRARFALILSLMFLIIIIVALNLNKRKTIENYELIQFKVSEIGMSTMSRKPYSTFSTKKQVTVEALKIISKKQEYFVDVNMKEFWSIILQNVKKNEQIKIYYQVVENNYIIVQLEHGVHLIFSLKDRSDTFNVFKWFVYLFSLLNLIILSLLLFKHSRLIGRK